MTVILRACNSIVDFTSEALWSVMGVVNVTPDSFSDGGRFFDRNAAVDHALQLAADGATFIDIGGESTRPRSEPVSEIEELRRVLPVIEGVVPRLPPDVIVSIDTQKPAVARAALEAGAKVVNDIAANREDPEMWRVVTEAGAGYVAMHMQGTPQTMQLNPTYGNVVADVEAFFDERLRRMTQEGMALEQVLLDVGIGFGKTLEHNLQLLGAVAAFKRLKRPLLLGVSRKSFIGKLLNLEVDDRAPAGIACACWAWLAGVKIIRTHDVRETCQALRMLAAIAARQRT